jgi:hypothetical protein
MGAAHILTTAPERAAPLHADLILIWFPIGSYT